MWCQFSCLQLRKRQALLALGLFARLLAHSDLSEDTNLVPLMANLWNLALKYGSLGHHLYVSYAYIIIFLCFQYMTHAMNGFVLNGIHL